MEISVTVEGEDHPRSSFRITQALALTEEETRYRKDAYPDPSIVETIRLTCTVCQADIRKEIFFECKVHCHVHLGVMLCKQCLDFYGTGDFSIDEDGLDKYCRWCGQGGILYICNQCPTAFCKKCVKRNISRSLLNELERDDWKCYLCSPKPLYELRALCWAVQTYLQMLSSNSGKKQADKTKAIQKSGRMEAQIDVARNWLKTTAMDLKQFSKNLSHRTDSIVDKNFGRRKMTKPADFDRYVASITSTIEASIKQLSSIRDTTAKYINEWKVTFAKTVEEEQQRMCAKEKLKRSRQQRKWGIRDRDMDVVIIEIDEKAEEHCINISPDYILGSSVVVEEVSRPVDVQIENDKREEAAADNNPKEEDTEDAGGKGKQHATDNSVTLEHSDASLVNNQPQNKPLLRVRNVDELNKAVSENSSHNITNTRDRPSYVPTDGNAVQNKNTSLEEANTDDTTRLGSSHECQLSMAVKEKEVKEKGNNKEASKNTSSLEKAAQMDNEVSERGHLGTVPATDKQISGDSDSYHRSLQHTDEMVLTFDMSTSNSNQTTKAEEEKITGDGTKEEATENVEQMDNEMLKRFLMKTSSEESSSEDLELRDVEKQVNLSMSKEKGKTGSAKKKAQKSNLPDSSSEDDIARLLDTSSLLKRPRRSGYQTSGSDPSSNGSSFANRKKKKLKTENDKKKNDISVLDFLSLEDSDENDNTSVSSLDLATEVNKLKSLSEKWCNYEDVSREIFFASSPDSNSDSDSDDILEESKDEKKKAKSAKSKKREKGSDNSDEDEVSRDRWVAGKWRRNKLLTEKLTSTDSSEAEERFNEFKKKRDTGLNEPSDLNKRGAKKKRKTVLKSDSDSSYKKSDLESSDWSSDEGNRKDQEPPLHKKRMKRIRRAASSDGSNSDGDMEKKGTDSASKRRKNIRKLLKEESLEQSTQAALKEEQERKKRIAERQKLYNQLMEIETDKETILEKLVLDFDPETKKELVSVNIDLVKKMKPHQAEGVKFMWDACFESLKDAKEGKGSGCIIAHCMGLGKSFQVVTLVHTLLTHSEVGVKNVLIVCPLSTVLNWANEFEKWLNHVQHAADIRVYNLTKVLANDRQYQIKDWFESGGVMVLGYNMYRQLTNPKARLKKAAMAIFQEALVDPGPDLVICDEGHILKNESTALSKAMNQLKTRRRIVLTGTPLQNNLVEYHCMVQFVKPNLLGTKKEFKNRFVNPIQNGQFEDSTAHDVKVMKRRAHVLHKLLDGIVQRKDYSVLTPFLPQKYEYVISINMSEVQCSLYRHYLDNFSRGKDQGKTSATLFKDWLFLTRICTHPRLILMHSEKEMLKNDASDEDSEGSLKDFIDDGSDSGPSSGSGSKSGSGSEGNHHQASTRSTRSNSVLEEPPEVEPKKLWWNEIASEDQLEDIATGPKIVLLLSILKKCEEIGDKLLVFSQSLYTLDLIEYFLGRIDEATQSGEAPPASLGGWTGSWAKGLDYFRLDGQTASEYRTSFINRFNNLDNTRARLFLISTKAGGLGINLVGANRVIIFDASWNPSFDVQSIFRIYRFGQKKPCYVYRFLAQGTIEERIYERQVAKLSISCRVVDEQQVDRHFSHSDLTELYTFKPSQGPSATPILPKDRLMAEMLQSHADIICTYHHHDSLLENQEEEELNEEERQQAWTDFENEKHTPPPPPLQAMTHHVHQPDYMGQELYTNIATKIKEKNPAMSVEQIQQSANSVLAQWRASVQNSLQQQHQQQQQAMFKNGVGKFGQLNPTARYPLFGQNLQTYSTKVKIGNKQLQQSYNAMQPKLQPHVRLVAPTNLVPNPKAAKRNIAGSGTAQVLRQLLTNNIQEQDPLEVHEIDE